MVLENLVMYIMKAVLISVFLFPAMNTLLKMYSLFVLCWDIVYVFFGCIWAVLESSFQMIKPPKQKSVRGEIVLVGIHA